MQGIEKLDSWHLEIVNGKCDSVLTFFKRHLWPDLAGVDDFVEAVE